MQDKNPSETNANFRAGNNGMEDQAADRAARIKQEIAHRICTCIERTGVADAEAALLAGVLPALLDEWRRSDPAFAARLATARAAFVAERLTSIRDLRNKDGQVDWRAQAWLLEHSKEKSKEKPAASSPRGPAIGLKLLTEEQLIELQERRLALARTLPNPGDN